MTAGEIVVIKTTGEKVYLIANTDRNTWKIRRPSIAENGAIEHNVEEFFEGEMETLPEFAERTISEMLLKAQSQERLNEKVNETQQPTLIPKPKFDPSVN